MHAEAYEFTKAAALVIGPRKRILEIGSLDVNGTIRTIWPNAECYVGVDLRPGRCVDVVADAATWIPDTLFDLVVSTECLEHAEHPDMICRNAYWSLATGGAFIVTAAGTGRRPHGVDGEALAPGEHYANITAADLRKWLRFFSAVIVTELGQDVRALAIR